MRRPWALLARLGKGGWLPAGTAYAALAVAWAAPASLPPFDAVPNYGDPLHLGWDGVGRASPRAGQRVLGWLAVVTAVAGGAMALGPEVHVAGRVVAPGPFAALHAAIPLARAMASPERFAALVVLGSAVLIGLGAASLFSARRRLAVIATLVLAVVLPLEHRSWPRPAALVPAGANRPAAFAFVAQQSTQPLVHLPLYPERSRSLWAAYLTFSTQHWRPIPVGRTSFYPPRPRLPRLVVARVPGRHVARGVGQAGHTNHRPPPAPVGRRRARAAAHRHRVDLASRSTMARQNGPTPCRVSSSIPRPP